MAAGSGGFGQRWNRIGTVWTLKCLFLFLYHMWLVSMTLALVRLKELSISWVDAVVA